MRENQPEMSENTNIRISKALKELNIGLDTALEHLKKKGFEVDNNPNAKITDAMHTELLKQFSSDKKIKEQAEKISIGIRHPKKEITLDPQAISHVQPQEAEPVEILIKNVTTAAPIKPVDERPKADAVAKTTAKIDNLSAEKPALAPQSTSFDETIKTEIKTDAKSDEVTQKLETKQPIQLEPIQPKEALVSTPIEKPSTHKLPSKEITILEHKQEAKTVEPEKPIAPIEVETPKPAFAIDVNAKGNQPDADKTEQNPLPPTLVLGKIDLSTINQAKSPQNNNKGFDRNAPKQNRPDQRHQPQARPQTQGASTFNPKAQPKPIEPPTVLPTQVTDEAPEEVIRAKADRLDGPTVVGKIDLSKLDPRKKAAAPTPHDPNVKRKRKRKEAAPVGGSTATGTAKPGTQQTANNRNNQQRQGGNNNQNRPNQPNQQGGGNNQQRPNNNQRPGQQGQNQQGQNNQFKGGQQRPNQGNRPNQGQAGTAANQQKFVKKEEPTEKDISDQIKATMARLQGKQQARSGGNKTGGKRLRREEIQNRLGANDSGEKIKLQVTEFMTTSDLASVMDVAVTEVIAAFFSLGMMVSINQRLDAETISIVADEFGFDVDFIKADENEPDLEEPDDAANMKERAPIVTIMGHVDHGKTSLLDYIRNANVIAGEAGGITQHIGAYEVTLENGKKITFLDTPGHEAFTAMRARGAKVTDIVVIVIAADDSVMPQTKEAISHAQAAGVPLIFAINKIDRPEANPEKIREQLSAMNILVESWGGKYQDQEISAKKGIQVDLLMEKILLEAEMLELKADPKKRAVGTVIEASLDKGKGIVATVLIQSGKLKMGDNVLAGAHYGRVKALMNERGQRVKQVGPSQPVQILGFNGAPQAGDKLYVTEDEQQAKDIANKRQQLIREQGLRTKKHITLDEIGRRLAIGDFQQLNIIVKGDVDGSVEALSDSLQKLSTEKIQVNIIHKGVGQISESDVLLASASDAIIVGFQVRPLPSVRKLAEQEEIDIRTYSIIYDAIDEVKAAMVGMLAPTFEEKVVCTIEIRETFKISKVGTIAGCMVLDGKVTRNTKIRVLRDGVVLHTGELASLKRFKDDVKEVNQGYECGLNINNFNDIRIGDIIEGYDKVEVKAKL